MCLHATALFTAQVAEAPLGLPKANTWNENAEQAPLLRALLQELFCACTASVRFGWVVGFLEFGMSRLPGTLRHIRMAIDCMRATGPETVIPKPHAPKTPVPKP